MSDYQKFAKLVDELASCSVASVEAFPCIPIDKLPPTTANDSGLLVDYARSPDVGSNVLLPIAAD